MAKTQTVDQFMAGLVHARRQEVEALRRLILSCDDALSEQVKWNAPSFGRDGDDRITMRLQPGDRLELIFHRGVKPKNTQGFTFDDPSGQIAWAAADRGVLAISDLAGQAALLRDLVVRWLDATVD